MKHRLFVLLALFVAFPISARQSLDSLLLALDVAIENSRQCEETKIQRIALLKEGLMAAFANYFRSTTGRNAFS